MLVFSRSFCKFHIITAIQCSHRYSEVNIFGICRAEEEEKKHRLIHNKTAINKIFYFSFVVSEADDRETVQYVNDCDILPA